MPITDEQRVELLDASAETSKCQRAEGCIRLAQTMGIFRKLNNALVMEEDEGKILFAQEIPEICPNRGQLFCQDRIASDLQNT